MIPISQTLIRGSLARRAILKRISEISPSGTELLRKSSVALVQVVHADSSFLSGKFNAESTTSSLSVTDVSTREKKKVFEAAGFKVDVIYVSCNTSPRDFRKILDDVAKVGNRAGVIVQRPVPAHLNEESNYVPDDLDLDPIHGSTIFKGPVTSETIARLVDELCDDKDIISVVGSRGFIGKGLYKYLDGIRGYDIGDDLDSVKESNVIISVAGVPSLLDERHIPRGLKLLVQGGFQIVGGKPVGDVAASALSIPRMITPVPGGVGPLEMATLVERACKRIGLEFEGWSFADIIETEKEDGKSGERRSAEVALNPLEVSKLAIATKSKSSKYRPPN